MFIGTLAWPDESFLNWGRKEGVSLAQGVGKSGRRTSVVRRPQSVVRAGYLQLTTDYGQRTTDHGRLFLFHRQGTGRAPHLAAEGVIENDVVILERHADGTVKGRSGPDVIALRHHLV